MPTADESQFLRIITRFLKSQSQDFKNENSSADRKLYFLEASPLVGVYCHIHRRDRQPV